MAGQGVTRREVMAAGAAALVASRAGTAVAQDGWAQTLDFGVLGSGDGVLHADDEKGHFALVEVSGAGLDLSFVREDGAVPFRRRFE